MTIDLSPEQERRLVALARRRGTTPESIVMSALEPLLVPAGNDERGAPSPGSLAELLQGHAGVFDSREWIPGGARLSETTSISAR